CSSLPPCPTRRSSDLVNGTITVSPSTTAGASNVPSSSRERVASTRPSVSAWCGSIPESSMKIDTLEEPRKPCAHATSACTARIRSEEHTSELQSHLNL